MVSGETGEPGPPNHGPGIEDDYEDSGKSRKGFQKTGMWNTVFPQYR